MARVQTEVRRETWDVDSRLAAMRLRRAVLIEIADVALNEAANATPFHPANSAGTFSYHQGTWALRDRHVGDGGWALERAEGVEAILNAELQVRVVFANVDAACLDGQPPKPRSRKGSGSERASSGNLFSELPQYARNQGGSEATFYLMVDSGGAVELTRATVENGTFGSYLERIYLRDAGEQLGAPLDDNGPIEFDPQIVRK